MAEYISKSALVAEIDDWRDKIKKGVFGIPLECRQRADAAFEYEILGRVIDFLYTLEVKEVDEQKERISECPYRQVGCTMYSDKILECTGACSWVVDHLKLKKLKAQKGE